MTLHHYFKTHYPGKKVRQRKKHRSFCSYMEPENVELTEAIRW